MKSLEFSDREYEDLKHEVKKWLDMINGPTDQFDLEQSRKMVMQISAIVQAALKDQEGWK